MTASRSVVRSNGVSPAATYLARLAPGSQPNVRRVLTAIAERLGYESLEACPWHELRYEHTAALRAGLIAHGYAPATVNANLSAVRGVLREAWRLGLIDEEDYRHAVDVGHVRNPNPHRGRALAMSEIVALFEVCAQDDTPQGARDGAMLVVLFGCGIRRAELAALDLRDYDVAARTLEVRHGKGDKARVAYLPEAAVPVLERWLEARGDRQGPLFWPATTRGGGVVPGRRVSVETVYHALVQRARAVGLADVTPHNFRRTFATNLLRDRVSEFTVQRLLGHASPATTAIYDYRSADEDRAAVEKHVHIPSPGGARRR